MFYKLFKLQTMKSRIVSTGHKIRLWTILDHVSLIKCFIKVNNYMFWTNTTFNGPIEGVWQTINGSWTSLWESLYYNVCGPCYMMFQSNNVRPSICYPVGTHHCSNSSILLAFSYANFFEHISLHSIFCIF